MTLVAVTFVPEIVPRTLTVSPTAMSEIVMVVGVGRAGGVVVEVEEDAVGGVIFVIVAFDVSTV
jgi:hypothetical protein